MSTGAGAPCEGIVSTVLVHRQAPQEGLGTGSTGAPQEGIVSTEAPQEGEVSTGAPLEVIVSTEAPQEGN